MDFSDLGNLQGMLSKAQAMQKELDERLSAAVVEADSGGGAVTVRMNGKKELLKLTIAPSAAAAIGGDVSMLEDLIVAAINAASRKADAAREFSSTDMLGGLNLPGF